MLDFSTIQSSGPHAATRPAASSQPLGASLLWGTMYIPYRKAYVSGMSPLSFVTIFTVGELGIVFALVLALDGGACEAVFHSPETAHMLFWLFLGGFVLGDRRHLPAIRHQVPRHRRGAFRSSNTNQLWGLAWGALVFGELTHADATHSTACRKNWGRW